MTAATEPPGCGPSSVELKANVANFMERAERIAGNPLAGQDAQFTVRMRKDIQTGEISATGFDPRVLPEDDWLAMAARMRPIIFLEDDPVSLSKLTAQIEREHVALRGRLKQARQRLSAWKRHAFVYLGNFEVAPPGLVAGEERSQQVRIGPPGRSPSGIATEGLATDFDYANTYLNAMVWHSDTNKSMEYQAASEFMKKQYRKCAEIRVLSAAKDIIPPLRQWILDARADGHDL
ncbi:hypothetical protein V6S02_09470 [Microbacterium sp. CCNWLW134]|uniref:hypothetical protein n=1 Tax=Microbacterium sp. CCNWLW134 TaxID=3122064 RepID=UPI00300FE57D